MFFFNPHQTTFFLLLLDREGETLVRERNINRLTLLHVQTGD